MGGIKELNRNDISPFNQNVFFKVLNIINIYNFNAIFRQPRAWLDKPNFRIAVYVLLIITQTGRELTSMLELTVNCLQKSNVTGIWFLNYYKGRGHQEKQQNIVTTDEKNIEEPLKGWVVNVIHKLINDTNELRKLLPKGHVLKNHLLLIPDNTGIPKRFSRHDFDAGRRSFQRRHGFYPARNKLNSNGEPIPSTAWVKINENFKDQYGINYWFSVDTKRIRMTWAEKYEVREAKTRKIGLAPKAMGNEPKTFDNAYRQGPTVEEQNFISLSLQEREKNYKSGKMLELNSHKSLNPVPNKIFCKDGTHIITPQSEKKALQDAGLKAFTTDVSGCDSLWFGKESKKNGVEICESGAKCFKCRSQRITEDTLWQTFSFYWACITKKQFMSEKVWSVKFKSVIEKCDNLINHPNLDPDVINYWKKESLDCPHPAWVFHLINFDAISLFSDSTGEKNE